MEVRKGKGVPTGVYVGTFQSFVTTKGKKPSYIHQSKDGSSRVCYIIKDEAGVEVPGSFPLDFDHYRCVNTYGAFGAPARVLEPLFRKFSANEFFGKVEKKLADLAYPVNVWVPESGWIGTIRPDRGSFQVEFVKVLTVEKDAKGQVVGDGNPIHVASSRTGKNASTGRAFTVDEDTFNVALQVTTGNNEGATFMYKIHYCIEDGDDGKKFLNIVGARGQEFYDFFGFHGITLENLKPEDFPDPDNLLPELEPMLQKAKVALTIEVENGWIKSLGKSPDSSRIKEFALDDMGGGSKSKRRPRKAGSSGAKVVGERAAFLGALQQVLSIETKDDPIVDANGVVTSMRAWKRFVTENSLPKKPLTKYTDRDVYMALSKLGYAQLAQGVRKGKAKKQK